MTNIFRLLFLVVTLFASSCSAPKPPKVSLTGKMAPVNFNDRSNCDDSTFIKSEQILNCYDKQFTYSIDKQEKHTPEFFYDALHADKIIAKIKPPFIEFMYERTIENLRSYGVTANIELLVEDSDSNQNDSQVTLECVKYEY